MQSYIKLIFYITFIGLFFWISFVQCQNSKVALHYREILSLSKQKPLIPINKDLFIRLVKTSAKNYSVVILFTAIHPQRGCQLCQMAYSEMVVVANSLASQAKNSDKNQKVFLGFVDFDHAPDVFQMMKFQSAPIILHFPVKTMPGKEDTMDLNRRGLSSYAVSRFILERTGLNINIIYPPDYTKIGMIAACVLVLLLIAYFRPNYYKFFLKDIFWLVIVLGIIICMLSGQMWNHIRGAPFAQHNPDGSSMYMTNHSHGQFVAESYIVASLYFLITLGLILLGDSTKKFPKLYVNRAVVCILGLILTVSVFGYLLSILMIKYPGYLQNYIYALQ
jgi:oligosaccharyltransferase complex subunit gamma